MQVLPQLVAAGFLGFSVAIMFLAYNLLREVVRNTETQNEAISRSRSRLIIAFLCLSAGVLVLGIVYSFLANPRQMEVVLSVRPDREDISGSVQIMRVDGSVVLYDAQQNKFVVRQGAPLLVDLEKIREKIDKFREQVEDLDAKVTHLEEQNSGLAAFASGFKNEAAQSPLDSPEDSF
ncbi:hypothetical protein ABLN87_15855 [Ruegeria sp. SCPT10]|uniref:hypothetical protein n=1 Tax=Ruegeria sp. SCP10 TaxID=3141377 RepID=UPI00333B51E5